MVNQALFLKFILEAIFAIVSKKIFAKYLKACKLFTKRYFQTEFLDVRRLCKET